MFQVALASPPALTTAIAPLAGNTDGPKHRNPSLLFSDHFSLDRALTSICAQKSRRDASGNQYGIRLIVAISEFASGAPLQSIWMLSLGEESRLFLGTIVALRPVARSRLCSIGCQSKARRYEIR
jgi:hypothetical protein